jgi:ribosomal protein L11 methyltransferase
MFGGTVRAVALGSWLPSKPTPPTRIGKKLEIVHDEKPLRGPRLPKTTPRLCIPHGIAFGSGEHATTFMLLRALAKRGDWSGSRILDLGTGSGVLALAARKFGARKIVATDFDADAVRTARQNEALNFTSLLIRWQRADVKKLRVTARYDLVLANLFSGILVEAAPRIAASIAAEGELWLSGILATQEKEVVSAYRKRGLKWTRTFCRGKWVMVQLRRS